MATKKISREIFVYASWLEIGEPVLMGVLRASLSKGSEIFSFEYDKAWLDSENNIGIDPDLQLFSGPKYLSTGKSNFGIFLDSSPDRWGRGRLLMRRREAAMARIEARKEDHLHESDYYLLGVFDRHRMGGIRFKENEDGDS